MSSLVNRLKALDDLQAAARQCVDDLQDLQRKHAAVAEDGTVMASARGSLLLALKQADVLHSYLHAVQHLPADPHLAKAALVEAIDALRK